jgi:hypothetical protein
VIRIGGGAGGRLRHLPAIAAAAALSAAGAAELVVNGGFEEPSVPACEGFPADAENGWAVFPSGRIPGWTVEWMPWQDEEFGGRTRPAEALLEFQWRRNARADPHSGDQRVELDTDWYGPPWAGEDRLSGEPANVRIYQDLATCPGHTYRLTYAWRPRTDRPRATMALVVLWDGAPVARHWGPESPGEARGATWEVRAIDLKAAGPATRLEFAEVGIPDARGAFLDSVSVTGPARCEADRAPEGGGPQR